MIFVSDATQYTLYLAVKCILSLQHFLFLGCEFTAIFLGTCEPTNDRGIPKNTTQTIMNHYVFNTALTRARYLVVAVGNPLQLLDKEEQICKTNPQDKHFRCWKEYIRRCIECKSFHLPKGVTGDDKDFTNVLYDRVFSNTGADTGDTTVFHGSGIPADSVLSTYKKKFENIPECKKSKLRLTRVDGGSLSWNIKDLSTEAEKEAKVENACERGDIYHCRLKMLSFSNAEAIPLDPSKRVVQIRGMGNMRGAFHEDIVEVVTFNEVPQPLCKGRVLRVIKTCHKETIVCKAHKYNPTLFCPIDKKYPVISNLPKLSKDLLEKRDKDRLIAELRSKDVVIFEPGSLTEGSIPEIKNVIPFSIAQDMLFVVRIVHWNPKFRLPLGVVIHALPKGSSEFHAKRILMIEHNVHYECETEQLLTSTPQCVPNSCDMNTRAFTIDPEDAVNLDDAISLSKNHDSYHLAVHIVNTTNEIAIDTELDRKARTRGFSVYGVKKVMNMLPAQTRLKLSLNPHQICDVITISGNVDISEKDINVKYIKVKESKIRSCAKLSYVSAQKVMDGAFIGSDSELSQYITEYDSDTGQPDLKETLLILLKIAMQLRVKRLGDLGALSYETNEEGEQECWQTHLMVEELMIWANNVIARELLSAFPECALLRRQTFPNAEELAATSKEHNNVISYSCHLSQYAQEQSPPQKALVVPMSILHTLLDAKETKLLCNLLTDDSLFPQLSAVSSHFRRIQQKAEYISATADADPEDYQHHSLNLAEYTHFTSPLRRYTDIIVQRMVKSLMSAEACLYNHDDIVSLCHSLNGALRNAKSFEKQMKTLMLAVEYTQSSKLYEAVIVKNTGTDIELSFLNKKLKDVPAKEKRFKVRHLNTCSRIQALLLSSDKAVYSWRIKMFSFEDQSSFPYDYEDLSFHTTEEAITYDFTTTLSTPCVSMKLYTEVKEGTEAKAGMLQPVIYHVKTSPSATILPPANWKQIVTFLKNPSQEAFRDVKDTLSKLSAPVPSTNPLIDHQNQLIDKSPVIISDIGLRMDVYDIVKVWMTWSTREAILAPQLQLIEVTPFFRICLQHNAHPAECFSDSHLKNASKERYTDLKEYVHLWEKVLLAEAAERSVNDNRSGIFFDVKLNWGQLVSCKTIDGTHNEGVYFELPSTISEAKPFLKVHVGDLMCVRYGTKKSSTVRAVFHLVVANNKHNKITLKHVNRDNVFISDKIKPLLERERCEIQVISMSPSYQ